MAFSWCLGGRRASVDDGWPYQPKRAMAVTLRDMRQLDVWGLQNLAEVRPHFITWIEK